MWTHGTRSARGTVAFMQAHSPQHRADAILRTAMPQFSLEVVKHGWPAAIADAIQENYSRAPTEAAEWHALPVEALPPSALVHTIRTRSHLVGAIIGQPGCLQAARA